PVDGHPVNERVDAAPRLGDELTVHGDPTLGDVLLADATRGDTGGGHHLLQALTGGSRSIPRLDLDAVAFARAALAGLALTHRNLPFRRRAAERSAAARRSS